MPPKSLPFPSTTLRNIMGEREITQAELAAKLGVSLLTVNQMCNDRRGITAEMAIRLQLADLYDVDFWMQLQVNWDVHRAIHKLIAQGVDIPWVKRCAEAEK